MTNAPSPHGIILLNSLPTHRLPSHDLLENSLSSSFIVVLIWFSCTASNTEVIARASEWWACHTPSREASIVHTFLGFSVTLIGIHLSQMPCTFEELSGGKCHILRFHLIVFVCLRNASICCRALYLTCTIPWTCWTGGMLVETKKLRAVITYQVENIFERIIAFGLLPGYKKMNFKSACLCILSRLFQELYKASSTFNEAYSSHSYHYWLYKIMKERNLPPWKIVNNELSSSFLRTKDALMCLQQWCV